MSKVKRFLVQFVLLAIVLAIIHWAMIKLLFDKIIFPPTLITGISANLIYIGNSPSWSVLVIILFHLLLFMILNVYLLIRVARGKVPSPIRAGIFSLVFTVLLAALSIRYWFWPIAHTASDGTLGGIRAGMQIQGAAYV